MYSNVKKIHIFFNYVFFFFFFLGKLNDASSRDSGKRNGNSDMEHSDEEFNEEELTGSSSCFICKENAAKFPNSIADKINLLNAVTASPNHRGHMHFPRAKIFPKESERIAFSQKYNPDSGTENDGFVPVPGPYGTRSVRLREKNSLKSPVSDPYKSTSSTRRPSKRSHDKNHHTTRQTSRFKHPQSVQRRAQYRNPKVLDEFTGKESISRENILGNGNFEIIKGGIFSDHDTNEILGSRRISRGFGMYIGPTHRQSQNRYSSVRNIQFPNFYQGRAQNPVRPMFYPRAPF